MRRAFLRAIFALLAFVPAAASASIVVGGYGFNDNAFVDQVTGSSGTFSTVGGTLSQVLTDKNPASFAWSYDQGAFLDLAFVDNVALNGAGKDIVLFELGAPNTWTVTINGISHNYTSVDTGQNVLVGATSYDLTAAAFDLSDFGIAAGGSISNFRLSFVPVTDTFGTTIASTSLVGALYPPVPEPATWMTMLLGFAGIGLAMRRRRGLPTQIAQS
jgi:hypothetical protein